MLRQILEDYRKQQFNKDKGDAFERLVCAWLKCDPQYQSIFSDVWLWKDWPQRKEQGYTLPDTGIDLVAKFREGETYCAIQCKFYDSPVAMSDLGNFFTLSGKGGFSQRIIVATAPLTKHAADALEGQTIPVSLITLEDMEEAPIDWTAFSLDKPDELKCSTVKKTPRPHQEEALEAVLKGFEAHDRGKLIMACGTGKTYTSLVIAQKMVKPGGTVLFLVPSISLLSQTLRAWTADASVPLRCFAVCSDSKASRNEEDMRISEMAYPSTTNPHKLAKAFEATQVNTALTVIFSTYQSIDVVHQAQAAAGFTFDLIICDEAHRTAGYTAKDEDHSAFVKVHDDSHIRGKKRLYMTATPRIYAEASKDRAKDLGTEVFSMDDPQKFGPLFHRLRFDEAVRRDLLSDYKVLIIAVDERHVNLSLQSRIGDSGDELNLDDAVKIVGCWTGLGKRLAEDDKADVASDPKPMRTALAFAGNIKHSKLVAKEFSRIADELGGKVNLPRLFAEHVDGTMNVVERNQKLSWLKANAASEENECRILTNAKCLSEGVDVPALDCAIFLNPRDSVVDVVQSVGRVMRKAPGKKYGYVILPIGIAMGASPENALNNNKKYRTVWQVLNALRAHDDRLDNQFAKIDLTGKSNGVVQIIGVGGDGEDKQDRIPGEWLTLPLASQEFGEWQDAIYGKIVHKCGDRQYWETWAKDIASIAERHQMRIRTMLEHPTDEQRDAFDTFIDGLRRNLNPSIDREQAVEMLAQHVITKPVFDALFEGYAFTEHNPVSQSMQGILDVLKGQALEKDLDALEGFYASIRERVKGVDDPTARQKLIVELYDKFFKAAFPKMVERLGIVYTPVEVVDFIIRSADKALQEHFGCSLKDEGIHILDPFTGTGTFPVRMMESGLIPPDMLTLKYRYELHANEIVLLAYYIAAINIEEAYHRVTGKPYQPFPGICLTDTFQMNENDGKIDIGLPENAERVEEQTRRDIRVIVGNPPYSVGQNNANDNNQNLKYPNLDARIETTYVAHSTATNKNSLYDSYIRAFRWASDRIGNKGVLCFVTNGAWLDSNTADGFRHELEKEFSAVYVFNLRGNQRTSGELSRREGGKIFGSGSRTPVAITLLIKKPGHTGKAQIFYHDIGDYLTREEKLHKVETFADYAALPWEQLHPNEYNDWINQRCGDFNDFVPLNDGDVAIFCMRSGGLKTNRDAWCYNFSNELLQQKIKGMIDFYNQQVSLYGEECRKSGKNAESIVDKLIDTNPYKIKWNRSLRNDLCKVKRADFILSHVYKGIYRPYTKQMVYFDRQFNDMVYRQPSLFPTANHNNLVIQVTGIGINKDFSCLVVDRLPDVQTFANGQCFPLYYYEKNEPKGKAVEQGSLIPQKSKPKQLGLPMPKPVTEEYTRKDAITDAALEHFQTHYEDDTIGKEDLFYYVYGILHSPVYRERYAADLKKMLPRVPLAPDFWGFSKAGRELAHWHLDYEQVEPWPVEEERKPQGDMDDFTYYHVEKMRFPKKGERGTIIYNGNITFKGIPLDAYDYVVNGKSALDWIMERYAITIDKDSGIRNDPNDWCREHNDPTYIYNLVKRIIRVSLETNRIVAGLPGID
ncbi:DEAD/DEAH box helicase [Bilophila wadsworthia]|uniref:DEAD/DEAH box helicase n=1 Tax=Bilophila wadsworthia TaxID=35833 RepID=UPI0026DD8CC5|nr:type ISP restriction/modification enzyme [Bilophila wadsworthia]